MPFHALNDYPTFLHFPGDAAPDVGLPLGGKGVLPIVAGSFLSLEGRPFRVRETWFILDRHGILDDGLHVYLEETDNRPLGAD